MPYLSQRSEDDGMDGQHVDKESGNRVTSGTEIWKRNVIFIPCSRCVYNESERAAGKKSFIRLSLLHHQPANWLQGLGWETNIRLTNLEERDGRKERPKVAMKDKEN